MHIHMDKPQHTEHCDQGAFGTYRNLKFKQIAEFFKTHLLLLEYQRIEIE